MSATWPSRATVTKGSASLVSVVVLLGLLFLRTDTVDRPEAGADDLIGRGEDKFPVSAPSFTISGNLAVPLSPGVRRQLNLSISNRNPFRLSVTKLTVTLQRISAPNADATHPCKVTDFAARQLQRPYKFIVRSHHVVNLRRLGLPRSQWPAISMLDTPVNQDGCKGVTLKLTYTGVAKRIAS